MNPRYSQRTDETNDLLRVCATQHSRFILSYFRNSSAETVCISDIVDTLETETRADRDQLATQLVHSTLPKLAAIGYLSYDTRSDTIRYQGHAELEALAAAIANR